MDRNGQIKFYKDLLKEDEILLLKSSDNFFKSHYTGSPLNVLTGFQGSAGEAVINKIGEITLFVDTRYHLLVDKQAYKDIKIYKMEMGETFFDALKKTYKEGKTLYIPNDIMLTDFLKLDRYFNLKTYQLKKNYTKNRDIDKNERIFLADSKVEKNDFNFKVKKFKKLNPKVEKIIIFDLDKISYFTNLRSFEMKYSSNFKSILYFDFKNAKYILFSDKIIKAPVDNLEIRSLSEFEGIIKAINSEIYIDYNDITLENFLLLQKPIQFNSDSLSLISSIKPVSVIENMAECSFKLDKAILNFKKRLYKGLSEYDLAQMFEDELRLQGSYMPSFKTILALDNNSASIHYSSYDKNKILKDEQLILLDCGGYWDSGYATDITRTFYFGKNPKAIYKNIYTAVLKTFIACFNSKETKAKKVDELARKMLASYQDIGFYFNHGLGHGIGTSCHQNPPCLSMFSNDTIKPYQTHSIEPGLYGKIDEDEFGVRIENCVYCDINYNRFSLSKFPFEEILIDYRALSNKEIDFIKKWQADFDEQFE
ncbi:MAG: aminopeptidase P family protein [Candidatus Gastranaerophilales bacterium]|nr:aminopeptidase P family protein [Candidatus Gastranaerophilales bacterium]